MAEGLDHNARQLLVTTFHSVLSTYGFVPIGRTLKDWSSTPFLMSIRYRMPRLNTRDEIILLKFQSWEHEVTVHGFVSCIEESYVHRLSLDGRVMAPNVDPIRDENEAENNSELWKTVKETFAKPLYADLENSGMFGAVSRFLQLPYDVLLKIFEALSGFDIARLECVCVELREFASNNDLWKMKFKKEFPLAKDFVPKDGNWKTEFRRYSFIRNLFGDYEDLDKDESKGEGVDANENENDSEDEDNE